MNPIVKQFAVKFGLIAAAVNVAYALIAYLVDETLFSNWSIGIGVMLIPFIVKIVGVFQARSAMGGYIEFKDAFSVYLVASLISILISTVMNITLFHVIDPELGDRVQERTIENTIGMMERMGSPQETIDETIDRMESEEQFSLNKQLMGVLWYLLIQAVLGLIIAAFAKRKKPISFDQNVVE